MSPIITCERYQVEPRHPQFIQVLPVDQPASLLHPGGIDTAPDQRSQSITPLKGMQSLSIASPKEPQPAQAAVPRPRRCRSTSPHSGSRSDAGSEGTLNSLADRPAWRGPMDLKDAGQTDEARRRWEARKQIEAEQRRKAKDNSWKANNNSPKKSKKSEGKSERRSSGAGLSGDDMQLDPSRRNTKSPNPEGNRRLTGESAVSARSTASTDSATYITMPGGPTFSRMLVLDNASAQQMTVQRIDGTLPASKDYAGRKSEDVAKPYKFFK